MVDKTTPRSATLTSTSFIYSSFFISYFFYYYLFRDIWLLIVAMDTGVQWTYIAVVRRDAASKFNTVSFETHYIVIEILCKYTNIIIIEILYTNKMNIFINENVIISADWGGVISH